MIQPTENEVQLPKPPNAKRRDTALLYLYDMLWRDTKGPTTLERQTQHSLPFES